MKKYLFAFLLLLLSVGTALADSYLYVDDLELSQDGSDMIVPVHAHFDARVAIFMVDFYLPDRLHIVSVRQGEDMPVRYLNANGEGVISSPKLTRNNSENGELVRYIAYADADLMNTGYWDPSGDGNYESYGSIKWEAGDYDQMLYLRLRDNEPYQEGEQDEIYIVTRPLSSSDPRGGTVIENGDNDQEFTWTSAVFALPGTSPGDVNGDGRLSISDVTGLIDLLLSGNMPPAAADVNGDGKVSIADVTALINYLLNGSWPGEVPTLAWVDLGLPSGTLWATCNVGADSPEDCGDYFAWGETSPKDYYDLITYKWCNGNENKLTKYCSNSIYGTVDNKTVLDLEDDAAYVNWGTSWCMPTHDQLKELFDNCTQQLTELNGVNCIMVTGPNRNTMFLPAAGYRDFSSLEDVGLGGYYWSCTLVLSDPYCAYALGFDSFIPWDYRFDLYRYSGRTVRAVRVP